MESQVEFDPGRGDDRSRPRARSCRSPKRALSNKNNTAFRDALFVLVIIMATGFFLVSHAEAVCLLA